MTKYSIAKKIVKGKKLKREQNVRKSFKTETFFEKFFVEFTSNTTLHGINHVTKPIFSKRERFLWILIFILGVFGGGYSCLKLWDRYKDSTTVTVVETTRYEYSNVPFPSVTVCDKSRVDWNRALSLDEKEFPEPREASKEKMLLLLKRIAYATFGDFDFFDQIRMENLTLTELKTINLTTLLLKLMRPCNEVFTDLCWFRDQELNCCSIFELQKTELGFCYSFNSDTSESSRLASEGWLRRGETFWKDNDGEKRPRRTAQSGPWSGLRFTASALHYSQMPPDGNDTTPGIAVIISDPKSELHSGYTLVAPGTSGTFPVWGDALVARDRVRTVEPNGRKCLFPDEDPYDLPQGHYLQANCRADCFRAHTLQYCNCVPDFIFPNYNGKGDTFPSCDAEGMICLSKYNDIFTLEVPRLESAFFENNRTGIRCECLPDCTSQQYTTELISPQSFNKTTEILIDVHFRLTTCTLYKTDIVYDWLDILVAFGGIGGLFLGASLMSFVELFYFITVRLFHNWNLKRKERKLFPWTHYVPATVPPRDIGYFSSSIAQ